MGQTLDNKNQLFRQNVLFQFNRNKQVNFSIVSSKLRNKSTDKPIKFLNLLALVGPSSPVPPRLSKKEINKSKFHGKNKSKTSSNYSYTQAFLGSIKEIKENFP